MYKKILSVLIILIIAFSSIGYSMEVSVETPMSIETPLANIVLNQANYTVNHTYNAKEVITIKDFINKGSIGFSLANFNDSKIKLMIKKDGASYTYDLNTNGTPQYFPLQMGNGIYEVAILESIGGTSYKYLQKSTLDVVIDNVLDTYLNPMQYNDWTKNKEFTDLIDGITANATTDKEVINSVYTYMVNNFSYDYNKASTVKAGYLPEISLLLNAKNGICYDYSAIFSAALRYKGIPTKLVKGYSTYVSSYHAWNEVFIDDAWVTVDVTIDAFYNKYKVNYSFAKASEKYTTKYVY